MIVLYGCLFCIALGTAVLILFLKPRFSPRRVWGLAAALAGVLALLNTVVFRLAGDTLYVKLFPLLNHPPLLALTFYISRQRQWRVFFQFLSGVLLCFFVQHASNQFYLASGLRPWGLILGYALVTPGVLWFFVKRLRPLYFEVVEQVGGWPLLCLPLVMYYIAMFVLLPDFVGQTPAATVLKPFLTFLMVSVYGVLMALFDLVRRQARERQDREMAALQRDALRSRLETAHAAEERARIERHDMRHRLNTLAALVEDGQTEAALNFIGEARRRLEKTEQRRWCADTVLNAVLDFYFSQAQERDVRVECRMAFPAELPAPSAELAMLLANGLENAIKACGELPREQRVLRCRSIASPRLMIEVENPCVRPPLWDGEGFPVATQPGHGVGMRSIRSICRQYGAECLCSWEKGWFRLRVVF